MKKQKTSVRFRLMVTGAAVMVAVAAPGMAQQKAGSTTSAATSSMSSNRGPSSFSVPMDKTRMYAPLAPSGNASVPQTQYMRTQTLYARAIRFAECAQGDPHVDVILKTSIRSQDEAREIGRFFRAKPRCRMDAEGLSPLLVRAALAEVALSHGSSSIDRTDNAPRFIPAVQRERISPRIDRNAPQMLIAATNVAACQAWAAPMTAHAVLATRPGSAQERAAENALFQAAPSCGGASRPDAYTPVVYRALIASVMVESLLDQRTRRG